MLLSWVWAMWVFALTQRDVIINSKYLTIFPLLQNNWSIQQLVYLVTLILSAAKDSRALMKSIWYGLCSECGNQLKVLTICKPAIPGIMFLLVSWFADGVRLSKKILLTEMDGTSGVGVISCGWILIQYPSEVENVGGSNCDGGDLLFKG